MESRDDNLVSLSFVQLSIVLVRVRGFFKRKENKNKKHSSLGEDPFMNVIAEIFEVFC